METLDREKLLGYIFGSACGDALGQPVEFLSFKSIQDKYGREGIQELPEQAHFTDDTKMMMALGRGLIETKEANLDETMNNVAQEFIIWLDDPGLAPGGTCISAVRNLQDGISWKESGITDSMGCGSAMRSGIIGLLYDDKERIKELAHYSGLITHGHKDADAAAQAAALLIYYAKQDIPSNDYPKLLLQELGNISNHFNNLVQKAQELANNKYLDNLHAMKSLGEGWTGSEAVVMALYIVLKYTGDYRKSLTSAVNITGDSDSIGAIAGGILGTKIGYSKFPLEWINKIVEKDELMNFANRIENYY